MKKNYPKVLFDLDGTLLDTAPDLAQALNLVLANNKLPPLPYETVRPYASAGTRGLLNLGFQISPEDERYDSLRQQFLKYYHEHLYDRTSIFPGMDHVLHFLREQQIPWGVVTNKPAYLANLLMDYFNLTSECGCIVGGDTLAKQKPSPEPLLYACEQMNISAADCIYIGDAERDIIAAKNANMYSIAALYGYIQIEDDPLAWSADFYIKEPEEIITWLDQSL